jgi:signal transduction histidine kinase
MKRSLLSPYRHETDVTEPRHTAEVFDSALVGFARWDASGRLTAANREFCRLVGVERKSLEHRVVALTELLPGVDWRTSGIQECRTSRSGTPLSLRVEVDADARQAFIIDVTPQHAAERSLAAARDLLEAHATAITGSDAAHLVPSARLRDAQTQLERQQIEIEELLARVADAHRELEAFSYSVSHDLRTPLRALDGFSRELLQTYASALDPKAQHYVARIRAGAEKLDRIVDDLLRLSRVGRTLMRTGPADLAAIARTIAAELAASAPDRRVRWIIPETVVVQADRQLITLVLQNLLSNSWKFTSRTDDAVIELRATARDAGYVCSVHDNGAGFDMRFADKLFAPFQRLHSTADFEGTGIGLATVKRIIHRHNGQVWAEGSPGQGATFSFTLRRFSEGHS